MSDEQEKDRLFRELVEAKRRVAELESRLGLGQEAPPSGASVLCSAFDVVSLGVIVLNSQGRLVYQNPAVEEITGWSPEELPDVEAWFAKLHPDAEERAKVIENWEQDKSRRYACHGYGLRARNGRQVWLHYQALFMDDGRILILFEDRTDEREQKLALTKSEERLRELYDKAPVGIFQSTPDGRFLFASSYLARMYGYDSPEELMSTVRNIGEELYANPMERQGMMRRAMERGEVVNYETRRRTRDGRIIWTNSSIRAIFDETGQVQYFSGFTEDITESVRNRQALADSEERFRQLVENVREVFWLRDMVKERILYVSPSYERVFGRSCAELLADSRSFIDAVHSEDRERVRAAFARVRDEEADFNEEYRVVLPGGEQRWVLAKGFVIRDAEGRPYRLVGLAEDVTERRETEQQMHRAMATAEAANKAKSVFLATMSHEIRTPLNGIQGMLQLLSMTVLDEEQHGFVHTAMESGRNLLRILSDVLDLARVEAGGLELTHEVFDLADVVEPVMGAFHNEAAQRGLELSLRVDERLPRRFLGDPVRIRQVLFNLVGNAVKYTDVGFVRLEVYPLPHSAEGRVNVHLAVSDTGIGIADDKMATIFDVFTQADSSATRRYGGAGLGLAIVRKLVELMDGRLSILSELGRGTEAHCTLSLEAAPAAMAPPVEIQAISPRSAKGEKPITVLVAEDDRVNRLSLVYVLKKLGYKVLEVENGRQALDVFARRRVDAVLMDIQMPEMDGVEATRHIRQSETEGRRVPILAITAYAMNGDRETFLDAGMDEYLPKPVEVGELQSALDRLLSGAASLRSEA